jgi:hypothetical protein
MQAEGLRPTGPELVHYAVRGADNLAFCAIECGLDRAVYSTVSRLVASACNSLPSDPSTIEMLSIVILSPSDPPEELLHFPLLGVPPPLPPARSRAGTAVVV